MRVIQVLGNLAYGDAIGYHAVAMKAILQKAGYSTEIYAQVIDDRYPRDTAKHLFCLRTPKENDLMIYHLSDGSPLNLKLKTWRCRKILMYHNITPPSFFEPYDVQMANETRRGLDQVKQLSNVVEKCITFSEFSMRDLIAMGYSANQIWVMPSCLIPFKDYTAPPDMETLKRYGDGWINILFVGRLAPNKKQEDVIRAFTYYKKYINYRSRLILVGAVSVTDYADALHEYLDVLGTQDVIFPGHISFAQLIAIYRSANIFLCMSEHEGFCVPLVEAMFFDLPIIAYRAAAISGTLDGCGVLLDDKDPRLIGEWIKRLTDDKTMRERIISGQRKRLESFQPQKVENDFLEYFKQIV